MMWMMVLCAVPLVILLFAGGKFFSAGYLWSILIGGFVVAHLWMMFRGHGHGSSDEEQHDMADTKQPSPENSSHTDEKKGHSNHSCCH